MMVGIIQIPLGLILSDVFIPKTISTGLDDMFIDKHFSRLTWIEAGAECSAV